MKIFLYVLFFFSITPYGFAENMMFPSMNTNTGLHMNNMNSNFGDAFPWVQKDSLHSKNIRANSGRDMDYTPTKDPFVSGSLGWSTQPSSKGFSGDNLLIKNQLPKTSLEENLMIFVAVIFLSLILFRVYRKNVL